MIHSSEGPTPTSKEIYDALREEKQKEFKIEGTPEVDLQFSDELKKQKERIEAPVSPVFGEWQLCPKCMGEGYLSNPKFILMAPEGYHQSPTIDCDVCEGKKILAKPVING